jgi:hypothetical protein
MLVSLFGEFVVATVDSRSQDRQVDQFFVVGLPVKSEQSNNERGQ